MATLRKEILSDMVNVPKCTGKIKLYSNTLSKDYDAENPDPTYVCVFCHQRPHHMGLGDLFGPYWLKELGKESAEDYNSMAESEKKKRDESFKRDSWLHADCALWVPCVLLGGSGEVEGLGEAVEQTGHLPCAACGARGASVGCTAHGCKLAMHLPCALKEKWDMDEDKFDARCITHM